MGEARAARDRASYNAKKAATATPAKPASKPRSRAGVKGGLGAAAAADVTAQTQIAPLPEGTPTVDEISAAIDRVQVLYGNPDDHPAEFAALVEEYGSKDLAIVHVGDLVAKRAEAIAGTSADEIEWLGEDQEALLKAQALAAKEKYGITELENRRAEIEAGMFRKETTPEEFKAAQAQISEVVGKVREFYATEEYAAIQEAQKLRENDLLGETGEKSRALAEAYQTVLRDLRPMGGELTFSADTNNEARAVFADGVQYFPSDWVDASSRLAPMEARLIAGRAHYTPNSIKGKTKTKIADHTIVHADADQDMTVWNNDNTLYRRVMDEPDGRVMWVHTTFETAPEVNGTVKKPRGKEWEEFKDRRGRQNWRREHTKTVEQDVIGGPEILANPDGGNLTKGTYSRAAIHELSHRMQHAVPAVARMEKAFLERRTTHADGRRHKQVNVSGGRPAEMGWADSFVEKCMGRDYGAANFTELLATGSESLFSGSYGGLIGRGRYQRDDEMRGFILGLFATGGRPKSAV
ncbi:hypothetical protein [Frondihabitans sucicola]|nr:hypothetical protein [Frondihabitans sucicola]